MLVTSSLPSSQWTMIKFLLTSTLLIARSHSTYEYEKEDEQQHWFFDDIVSSSASQRVSPFDDKKLENNPYQDANKVEGTRSSSTKPPCRCWNFTDDILQQLQIECICSGQIIKGVPRNFPANVQHITMYGCGLQVLRSGELQVYADNLSDFVLDKADNLAVIEEGAFRDLIHLQRIFIRDAPRLINLPDSVFSLFLPSLNILLIKQTGIRKFPNLSGLKTSNILHTVDLGENHFERIPSNSVRLRVVDFSINDNQLRSIELYAFNGSQIATLNLKGNTQLVEIHPDAFAGLISLRHLDASQTAITQLPTRGLSELEILRLTDTKSLKEIPSVYNYQWLREAHLTYPYHCCAFAFPATHDPQEHARHQHSLAELQAKYCNQNSSDAAVLQDGDSMMYDNEQFIDLSIPSGVGGSSSIEEQLSNEGIFHPDTFQVPSNRLLLFHAFCGNLSAQPKREVFCTPQPDAFNPCEDILGATWLRIAAWLVSVASVVGNLAVVCVLIQTSRWSMTVSKFLMINLALADLCMGFYLFLIVGMDLNTIGVYFNYAIDWQNGLGCQVAGFLTVFATELSVFTLVVITIERWYTITYAINLSRRLRLSTAAKIVAAGWIGSLTMATLPLTGVSSFYTTSICLPLENRNLSDTIYLLLLLILNGLAFLFICLCYGLMYRSISGQHQTLASHSDATVAKRMAILVFTNLVCWTPIAFFGLTAVAGYPLISVTHTKILLIFFYPLNACTNPYLYALLTKQYRRDFFQLLRRYGLCEEQVNRFRTTTSSGKSNAIRAGSQLELAMGVKKAVSSGSPKAKFASKKIDPTKNGTTKRNAYRFKAEPEEELDGAIDQQKQLPMVDSIHQITEDGTAIVVVVGETTENTREDNPTAVVVCHRVNKQSKVSVRSSSFTSRPKSSDSPHPVKNHQVRVSSQADTILCASKLSQSKGKWNDL